MLEDLFLLVLLFFAVTLRLYLQGLLRITVSPRQRQMDLLFVMQWPPLFVRLLVCLPMFLALNSFLCWGSPWGSWTRYTWVQVHLLLGDIVHTHPTTPPIPTATNPSFLRSKVPPATCTF